jgi:hypothetical protein
MEEQCEERAAIDRVSQRLRHGRLQGGGCEDFGVAQGRAPSQCEMREVVEGIDQRPAERQHGQPVASHAVSRR